MENPISSFDESEKLRQLMMEVSGTANFYDTSTEEIPVITSVRSHTVEVVTRKGKGFSVYTNPTLSATQLILCAILQHIQDCSVMPAYLYVSAKLSSKIIEEMESLYAVYDGTVPVLTKGTVRYIPLCVYADMPEDTVVCKEQ